MEHAICLLLGFLGVICHCLLKLRDLKADAKAANIGFNLKDYWRSDWPGISLSFIAVIVWVFVFGEVSQYYPKLENFIRISFVGVGLTGSYLIQKFSSKSKKVIRDNFNTPKEDNE